MKILSTCLVLASWVELSTQESIFSKGSKGSPSKGKGKTSAPSISPAPSICQDNPGRFLVPGTGGNDMRLCDWVNRVPGNGEYPWRCNAYPEAAENCPVSCGTCPGTTRSPSSMPSASPSDSPSAMPTPSPSAMPSPSPSASPSDSPSGLPSVEPTPEPSAGPTSEPSPSPSGMPTIFGSSAPSISPSDMPTPEPSAEPSAEPSPSPSDMPSDMPSMMPSPEPSPSPSDMPSTVPSFMPTIGPSIAPSSSPTESPTASPTYVPSSAPTCPPSKGNKGGKGKGCKAPSPTPSAAPTVCQDTADRFPVNGVRQACVWVLNGGGPDSGLPWRCDFFPEAKENCPFTCGECGCLDTTARFNVTGTTGGSKSCEWVARRSTNFRCGLDNIRFLCPATCDNCP